MKPTVIVLVQLGSVIDLFLTTNKYLFQKTNSLETSISDPHPLKAVVLQTTYERFSTKLLTYGSYEQPWNDSHINKFKSEGSRNSFWRY